MNSSGASVMTRSRSGDQTGVTFRYKDYRRDGSERQRVMTLAPVHPSLPAARPAARLSPHPALRPARQFRTQDQHCACPRTARRGATPSADRRYAGTARSAATVPLLRRPHDRHRDPWPMAAAPRAAAVGCGNRGCFVVTRHGMRSSNAATLLPRLTEPHAFCVKFIASQPNFAAGQHSIRRRHGAKSHSPILCRRLLHPAPATLAHCENPKYP